MVINKNEILVDGLIMRHQPFIYSRDANGTVVLDWEPPMIGIVERWLSKTKSEAKDTVWFRFENALTQNCQRNNSIENLFLIRTTSFTILKRC